MLMKGRARVLDLLERIGTLRRIGPANTVERANCTFARALILWTTWYHCRRRLVYACPVFCQSIQIPMPVVPS
jgi:hypothetical protein